MTGANLACVNLACDNLAGAGAALGPSLPLVCLSGRMEVTFLTDITTLPDEFFTRVAAAGVFDDDADDDADERMMTTVAEVPGMLLPAARRPILSDEPP